MGNLRKIIGLALLAAIGAAMPELARAERSSEVLLAAGELELQKGNFSTAARYLDDAVVLDPTDRRLAYLGGMAHERAGNYERAEEMYRRILDSEPLAMLRLAVVRSKVGDWEAVYTLTGRYLQKTPRDPRANLLRGIAAYHIRRVEDARKEFGAAIGLDEDLRAIAQYYKGLTEFMATENERAVAALKLAKANDGAGIVGTLSDQTLDLIEQRGEVTRWWWADASVTGLFETNRPLLPDEQRAELMERPESKKAIAAPSLSVDARIWAALTEKPVTIRAGYGGMHSLPLGGEGTQPSKVVGDVPIITPHLGLHTAFVDFSKYIPLESISLEPALEYAFAGGLDMDRSDLYLLSHTIRPRTTFYFSSRMNLTAFVAVEIESSDSLPSNDGLGVGGGIEPMYIADRWNYVRLRLGGRMFSASDDAAKHTEIVEAVDFKSIPVADLLLEGRVGAAQQSFASANPSRSDNVLQASGGVGYLLFDRHFRVSAVVGYDASLSSEASHKISNLVTGLRIGGVF